MFCTQGNSLMHLALSDDVKLQRKCSNHLWLTSVNNVVAHEKRKLSEDELLIFSDGFDYIHDQFIIIQSILETTFNNDISEMEKCSQTINLLLYVQDFEAEIDTAKNKAEGNKLSELEQNITNFLEKKENAPDEYFLLLDDIIAKIQEKSNVEIQNFFSFW